QVGGAHLAGERRALASPKRHDFTYVRCRPVTDQRRQQRSLRRVRRRLIVNVAQLLDVAVSQATGRFATEEPGDPRAVIGRGSQRLAVGGMDSSLGSAEESGTDLDGAGAEHESG